MGFVFSSVLPALPWLFWVIGIIGYLIFFAEALIAINIWAVAQSHPDGQGPTSSVGKEGLMLIIRLIFQPTVMVLAFTAAVMLMEIAGRFVAVFTMPVLSTSIDSVFGFVGMATMFMVIMVMVAWTIFGLISQLSSQVFNWIGQAHHDLGENKGEQSFMAAVSSSKGVPTALGGGVGGGQNPLNKTKPDKNLEAAVQRTEGGGGGDAFGDKS